MTRRMIIMLVAVGVVFGGLYGFQLFKASMISKVMAGLANPPQTVATVRAAIDTWQPQIEAVGSLRAVSGADLSLQVAGIVSDIQFTSGATVAAGQVLLKLRADDDIAKLASLEATAELYAATLKRDEEQLKIHAVSQATIDTDRANLKNARALADQQRALVDQKTLRAPFAGRLGIRSVDIGQYLSAGTAIVTLQALDPIYVDFYLPQQTLDQIRVGQAAAAKVDTYPGMSFNGDIAAINPKVDATTRNVQVRAVLANSDGRLLPGMYATVALAIGKPQHLITLPQTAITANPYGDTVFIVDKKGEGGDKKAEDALAARQVFVKSGATRGDQIAVTEGVKEGDTVVVAGQMKLRNGTPVIINNSTMPTADASPVITDQ